MIEQVVEALRELVECNERHDAACAEIIGKPVGWKDTYLDAARAALAELQRWSAHEGCAEQHEVNTALWDFGEYVTRFSERPAILLVRKESDNG